MYVLLVEAPLVYLVGFLLEAGSQIIAGRTRVSTDSTRTLLYGAGFRSLVTTTVVVCQGKKVTADLVQQYYSLCRSC